MQSSTKENRGESPKTEPLNRFPRGRFLRWTALFQPRGMCGMQLCDGLHYSPLPSRSPRGKQVSLGGRWRRLPSPCGIYLRWRPESGACDRSRGPPGWDGRCQGVTTACCCPLGAGRRRRVSGMGRKARRAARRDAIAGCGGDDPPSHGCELRCRQALGCFCPRFVSCRADEVDKTSQQQKHVECLSSQGTHLWSTLLSRSVRESSMRKMSPSSWEKDRAIVLCSQSQCVPCRQTNKSREGGDPEVREPVRHRAGTYDWGRRPLGCQSRSSSASVIVSASLAVPGLGREWAGVVVGCSVSLVLGCWAGRGGRARRRIWMQYKVCSRSSAGTVDG